MPYLQWMASNVTTKAANMNHTLPMEIRNVDTSARTITGVVAPYNETTYLVADAGGERIMRNAFNRSIAQRGNKIPLCINHDHSSAVGMSREWHNADDGLTGTFEVRNDPRGIEVLADVELGYLAGMSVGFTATDRRRNHDGVMEVREARLFEVSLVLFGAYDGAKVLATRQAQDLDELLKPFQNPPALPIPFVPPWA